LEAGNRRRKITVTMAANSTKFTRENRQLTKIAGSFSVTILIKNLPRAGFLNSTVRTCAKRWTVAEANCYCREKGHTASILPPELCKQ
jgi:hypothetical protein